MYQNIWVDRHFGVGGGGKVDVHLWDDKIGYNKIQFQDYAYEKSQAGTYYSLYGEKLKKINRWTREDFDTGNILYADVMFETKVLVELYNNSDDASINHREMIFDIEVEVTNGFPDWKVAENIINSIALYDKVTDQYTVLILARNMKPYTDKNVFVEVFESEEELLQRFCQKYLEISPTILTGWNIEFFDIPYLYNRITRVLGEQFANCLSPIGRVMYDEYRNKYRIAGVSQLDYLALYKLYTYSQEPSYRLDAIGQKEVGIGKVEYEGTLNDLYESDIKKFIDYNLNDVIIVAELDKKLQFIDLARAVAHKGHIPYEDVFMSSRYLEGAMMVYMKNLGIVPPLKPKGGYQDKDKPFSGAYVKDPIPGRYEWVYDLDLTSMYPSTIMTLNTSPETKLGRIINWDSESFATSDKIYQFEKNKRMNVKFPQSFTTQELKDLFDKYPISISANGVIYKNNKQGLIPSILSKWFDERVEYKGLMKKFGNEGVQDKYEYFKKRQLVQKILLNSMYGVLGSPTFRFYDVDNAEATTLTGQHLIKYTQRICNEYYNNELSSNDDHVIYTDTDSIFVSSMSLIQKRFPHADVSDDNFMTDKILVIAKEVQDHLNMKYNDFAKDYLNCDNHRFDIKQEVIAKSAFWVAKKRYGQWIINENGVECDKLDVKGLDIIRSSFPPAFRDLMTKVLQAMLNNQEKQLIDDMILEFKDDMKNKDILEIALNTSVKGLQKYVVRSSGVFTNFKKGAPVHVKAAVRYNDLLKMHNLHNKIEPIRNSDKIKWVYLKENPYDVKSMALKGYDDPKEIQSFVNEYIDHEKLFESQLNKKIKMFYNALSWDEPRDKKFTLERFF